MGGGEPGEYRTEWTDDPAEALAAIQQAEIKSLGDLGDQIRVELESARQAVAATPEDDPCGLAEHYAEEVEQFEELAAAPLPDSLAGQLTLLWKLYAGTGEGIGNILDVMGVSRQGGPFITRVLSEDDFHRVFGTDRPTKEWRSGMTADFLNSMGRGESVCFPLCEDGETAPAEWCFFGYGVD